MNLLSALAKKALSRNKRVDEYLRLDAYQRERYLRSLASNLDTHALQLMEFELAEARLSSEAKYVKSFIGLTRITTRRV